MMMFTDAVYHGPDFCYNKRIKERYRYEETDCICIDRGDAAASDRM